MPTQRFVRLLVRGAAVGASLFVTTGVLAATHEAQATAKTPHLSSRALGSTLVAPPTTTPPTTTPPTTAAPAPKPAPVPRTPTTVRPRPTSTAAKAPARTSAAAPAPSGTEQERGEQALARINYPWQTLGYTISFEPGRQTYLGLTESGPRIIHIYVRGNESLDTLTRTIGHELGHALDFTLTSDDERTQYIAIRGINATLDTWYGCDACEDYSTAAGDWAETFQYWLLGPGQYYSKMGPPPTADQLTQLSAIFAPQ
jgi:hypothetical protein